MVCVKSRSTLQVVLCCQHRHSMAGVWVVGVGLWKSNGWAGPF